MERTIKRLTKVAACGAALALLLAFSLACGAKEESTPTPAAKPTPTVASATVSTPTATPTPRPTFPTPTPATTSGPKFGGVLRWVGDMQNVRTLDPAFSIGWPEFFVYFSLYNTFVSMGLDGKLEPELAQSWEISPDLKAITLRLAKGVKFSDGTPFNAEAAKWNLDRNIDPQVGATQRSQLDTIDKVEVVDNDTIKISLKIPWRPLLASLTERPGFVASPTAVEKYKSRADKVGGYGTNPSGTGPFKLTSFQYSSRIVLERNSSYWMSGKPYLDSIVYSHVLELNVAVAMVRTNEADLIEIPGEGIPLLKLVETNPNINIIGGETGRTYHVQMDTVQPPYNNKALRQAVAYALDRKSLINSFFGGRARVAYTQEGNGWAYNPDNKVFDYDPAKAKTKLVEAGYPNGVTLDYWCQTGADKLEYCSALQAQLGAVGIKLNIIVLPYSDIMTLQYGGKGAWMRDTWWSSRADPHVRLLFLYHSKGNSNTVRYSNPQVDKILDEVGQIYDIAKAAPMYWNVQKIMAEDAAYVYIAHPNAYMVATKPVQNFKWYPDVIQRLRDIWLQ